MKVKFYDNYELFLEQMTPNPTNLAYSKKAFEERGFVIKLPDWNSWCNAERFDGDSTKNRCNCTCKNECKLAYIDFLNKKRENKLKRILND